MAKAAAGSRPFLDFKIRGRSIRLPRDGRAFHVRYRDDVERPERQRIEAGITQMTPRFRYEVPDERMTVVGVPETAAGAAMITAFDAANLLTLRDDVENANPLFIYGDKRIAVSDRVSVKARVGQDAALANLMARGLSVLEVAGNTYLCRVAAAGDAIGIAEELSAEPWVDYAEADLITIGTPLRRQEPIISAFDVQTPPQAPQQALRQIKADSAWVRFSGSPDIVVAVLDDGGDIRHPALSANVAGRYDAITDAENVSGNAWDAHGTACAGLIAARDDAASFRGVAAGCRLLMVRIAQSPQAGQPWATASSIIRRGIDWAVGRGAAVLSNSWGGGAPSTVVLDALERARIDGRGGKGCVLVVAAGNSSGAVAFPGNISGVLTVSGVNALDEFKTTISSDGEDWWGSNFGPEVDIAAPSVGILTTDIVGADGRSVTDYFSGFNGTSAATPLVAGAVALLLSSNPALTEQQARDAICAAADKVGSTSYQPDRNDLYGFGRLNVIAALTPPAPSPRVNRIEGRITAVALSGGLSVFLLEASTGAPMLLTPGEEGEPTAAELLASRLAQTFGPYLGQRVAIEYSTQSSNTALPVLYGARIAGGSGGSSGSVGSGTEPAANEVRLPTPTEDVFASLH